MENHFQAYVWKKEYETGIEEIDRQHRGLFKNIDKLLLAIYQGKEEAELYKLGKFMMDYIEEHFTQEEDWMRASNYPELENHINEHKNFVKLYQEFKEEMDYKGPSIYLANRMLKALRSWWEVHILKSDMLYRSYVRKIL